MFTRHSRRERFRNQPKSAKFIRSLRTERLEDRNLLATTAVAYQVHALQAGTNTPITTVQVGQEFDLQVTVQDVRTPPGSFSGVFAAYFDILESNKSLINVKVADPANPSSFSEAFRSPSGIYPNQVHAADGPDRIDDVGAVASVDFHGDPTAQVELVRARVKAVAAGSEVFTPQIISATGTVNDSAGTVSQFKGDASLSSQDDFYANRVICFTSGPLAGQQRRITQYVGATHTFTVDKPLSDAPTSGDAFAIGATTSPAFDTLVYDENGSVALNRINAGTAVTLTITSASTSPWYNVAKPLDVDNDGNITPLDALHIFNYLNSGGSSSVPVPAGAQPGVPYFYDVNGDSFVSPIDMLLIYNYLNSQSPASDGVAGANVAAADPALIQVKLSATDLAGTPIDTIAAGGDFLLKGTVRDLRGDSLSSPRGVYAAYSDITYDTNVSVAGLLDHGIAFVNGMGGDTSKAGLLDEVGGFAGPTPGNLDETVLFTVPMHADAAGNVSFALHPASVLPAHQALLLGNETAVPSGQISFINASLTVTPGSPIVAKNDSATVAKNAVATTIDVLANDTVSPSGGTKNVVAVTQPTHGTATFTATNVAYTPASGFTGTDTFTYSSRNMSAGETSATSTATVTVVVTGASVLYQIQAVKPGTDTPITTVEIGQDFDLRVLVQDLRSPPTANPGVFAAYLDILEDKSLVSVHVADPNNPDSFSEAFRSPTGLYQNQVHAVDGADRLDDVGALLQISPFVPPGTGLVELVRARMTATSTGTETFTPQLISASGTVNDMAATPSQFNGGDSLSSQDGFYVGRAIAFTSGALAGQQRVVMGYVGSTRTFTVVSEDVGLPFSTAPAMGDSFVIGAQASPSYDTLILDQNNPVTPDQISGGTPATLSIISLGQIQAGPGTVATLEDTATVPIDVLAYVSTIPSNQAVTLNAITQPANGTAAIVDGKVVYTPAKDFNGTDTFSYTAALSADATKTATGTVTVTVTGVNDVPTLDPIADPAAILEDAGQQTVNLSGISAGGGETQMLTITAVSSNPDLIPNPTLNYTSPGATGSLSYTPVANRSGTATITVTIKDDAGTDHAGSDTTTQTFTVHVTPVNDPPSCEIETVPDVTDESGPITITGFIKSCNPGALDEVAQSLSLSGHVDKGDLFAVPPSIDSLGTLTFTPAPNADGTATTSLLFKDDGGTDNGGSDTSQPVSFTIHITKLHPLHNSANVLDASGDGHVSSIDALDPINYINSKLPDKVSDAPPGAAYLDVNGDGSITSIDPLLVINWLNSHPNGEGEAAGSQPISTDGNLLFSLLAADVAEQAARQRKLR